MKKKALVLLLVLSLVIGTFTGLTFMTATSVLAGDEQATTVTEEMPPVSSSELVTYTAGVPSIGSAVMYDHVAGKDAEAIDYAGDKDGDGKVISATPLATDATTVSNSNRVSIKANLSPGKYLFSFWVLFPEATETMNSTKMGVSVKEPQHLNSNTDTDNYSRKVISVSAKTWTYVSVVVNITAENTYYMGYATGVLATAKQVCYIDGFSMMKITDNIDIDVETTGNELLSQQEWFGTNVMYGGQKFLTPGSTYGIRYYARLGEQDYNGDGLAYVIAPTTSSDGDITYVEQATFTAGTYVFSAYARVAKDAIIKMSCVDAGSFPHSATDFTFYNIPANTWTKITFVFDIATDGKYTFGMVACDSQTKEQTIYLEEMSLKAVQEQTATTYGEELISNGNMAGIVSIEEITLNGTPIQYNGSKPKDDLIVMKNDPTGDGKVLRLNKYNSIYNISFQKGSVAATIAEAGTYRLSAWAYIDGDTAQTVTAAIPKTGNAPSNTTEEYCKDYTVQPQTWTKVEFTGEVAEDDSKIRVGFEFPTNTICYLDGISFKKVEGEAQVNYVEKPVTVANVTLKTEGPGSAKIASYGNVTQAKVLFNTKALLIATPEDNRSFVGWFDQNGKLISDKETYALTVNNDYACNQITAKFSTLETSKQYVSDNLIVNGDASSTTTAVKVTNANHIYSAKGNSLKNLNEFIDDGYFSIPAKTDLNMSSNNANWKKVLFYTNIGDSNGVNNYLTLGKTYTISAKVRASATPTETVKVRWTTAKDAANVSSTSTELHLLHYSDYVMLTQNWQTVEMTFTYTQTVGDAHIGLTIDKATASVDVDDIKLYEVDDAVTVPVIANEGGSIEGNTVVRFGETATFTAVPNITDKFVGWYVDGECVSTDAKLTVDTLSVKSIQELAYTAKFKTLNYYKLVGDLENRLMTGLPLVTAIGSTTSFSRIEDIYSKDNHVLRVERNNTEKNDGLKFGFDNHLNNNPLFKEADTIAVSFKVRVADDYVMPEGASKVTLRLANEIKFVGAENIGATVTTSTNDAGQETFDKYGVNGSIAFTEIKNGEWTEFETTMFYRPETIDEFKTIFGENGGANNITEFDPKAYNPKDIAMIIRVYTDGNIGSNSGGSYSNAALEFDDIKLMFIKDGAPLEKYNDVNVAVEGADSADISVKQGPNNVPSYFDGETLYATVMSGKEITVTAKNNDNYVLDKIAYADQKNGANIAKNGVATLVAYGTTTNLTAKFTSTDLEYVTFKYVIDEKETIVAVLATGEIATGFEAPELYGRTVVGYKVNDGEVDAQLPETLADGDVVEIVYVENAVEETKKPVVTVTDANKATIVPASGEISQDNRVEPFTIVTFRVTETENFAYWEDAASNVVSTKENYTCYITGDVTLTPVYKTDTTKYDPTKAGDAELAAVTIKAVNTNDGKIAFIADRSAAKDKTITKFGIIIAEFYKDKLLVEDKGSHAGGRVIVSERTNSTTPNGTYIVTKGNMGANGEYEAGKTLYARAYVVVDGEYIYSAQTYESFN